MYECSDCSAIVSVSDFILCDNGCPSCGSPNVADVVAPSRDLASYDTDDDNARTGGAHITPHVGGQEVTYVG